MDTTNMLIALVTTTTIASFHQDIISGPARNLRWPDHAPQIMLTIQNKTTNRIEARNRDNSIGYINSSDELTVPIFNPDATVDRTGREWEVSELFKFFGPDSRRVSLNPSLFVSRGTLLLNYPHYINLRRSTIAGADEIDPCKKYLLIFTIQGDQFDESTIKLQEES